MDDLDKRIDSIAREALFTLIQENHVRVSKNNIRYTKMNLKHSVEHLDAQFASHEKLLRSIPRQLLNVEKKMRLKYVVPMSEARRHTVVGDMNREVDLILGKMTKQYRDLYVNLKLGDEFDRKLETARQKTKEAIEEQAGKLVSMLQEESSKAENLSPSEISEMYHIEENNLVNMGVVQSLQDIHRIFNRLKTQGSMESVFQGVQEGIALSLKEEEESSDAAPLVTVAARKMKKLEVAKNFLVFRDVTLHIHRLAQQLELPLEQRNKDVYQKIWARLEEVLRERNGSELILSKFKPFYELLES